MFLSYCKLCLFGVPHKIHCNPTAVSTVINSWVTVDSFTLPFCKKLYDYIIEPSQDRFCHLISNLDIDSSILLKHWLIWRGKIETTIVIRKDPLIPMHKSRSRVLNPVDLYSLALGILCGVL